jgi:hypothetical protein
MVPLHKHFHVHILAQKNFPTHVVLLDLDCTLWNVLKAHLTHHPSPTPTNCCQIDPSNPHPASSLSDSQSRKRPDPSTKSKSSCLYWLAFKSASNSPLHGIHSEILLLGFIYFIVTIFGRNWFDISLEIARFWVRSPSEDIFGLIMVFPINSIQIIFIATFIVDFIQDIQRFAKQDHWLLNLWQFRGAKIYIRISLVHQESVRNGNYSDHLYC